MLGKKIKQLRNEKGMTQDELATRLSVVRQTVSKWEKGFAVPDAEMIVKIADALGTTVNDLLGSSCVGGAGNENEDDPYSSEYMKERIDALMIQLARISEQLEAKNDIMQKIWILALILLGAIAVGRFLALISGIFDWLITSLMTMFSLMQLL